MNKSFLLIVVFVFPLFLTGCSNHVQLSGQVTYSDDGTPLEAGAVIFDSESFHARGYIGKDGRYTLATHKPGDGLPPGKYQIYVNGAVLFESLPGSDATKEVPLITPKFSDPNTSGLELVVDKTTKTFDFQVDRQPGSKP